MDQEQRIEALEEEVRVLKGQIRNTLTEIQATLLNKPTSAANWQKKAWVLALLNTLLAVALFCNIYLYLPDYAPFALDINVAAWLRAAWIALAFIWLLLQMYPLILLLGQEDAHVQGIAWRNAAAFFRARPGSIVLLTLSILVMSVINLAMPMAWILVALALLAAVGGVAMQNVLQLLQAKEGRH